MTEDETHRLDSLTDSMDMSLSKVWEMVKVREAQWAAVPGVSKSRARLSDSTAAATLFSVRTFCL